MLSGSPGPPGILSNVTEIESSKYKLDWETPSFTNILEHLLIYKQVKVWLTAPTFSSQMLKFYHRKEKYYRTWPSEGKKCFQKHQQILL